MFIDSTGRAYSLEAHQLPAARGYGEPLSGTVDPPDGATFAAVLIGEPDDKWLLASDAGYGFAAKLRELYARNKKGKFGAEGSRERAGAAGAADREPRKRWPYSSITTAKYWCCRPRESKR